MAMLFADALTFWQGIGLTVAITVGSLVLTAVGGYIFVRVIAVVLNSKRDTWNMTAEHFGLTADMTQSQIAKPLEGTYKEFAITVTSFGVPTGESSFDMHVACEAFFPIELKEYFEIKPANWLIDKVGSLLDMTSDLQIGSEPFDKKFRVNAYNPEKLVSILTKEMLDGRNPTLLVDMLGLSKKRSAITATNRSVRVSRKCEPTELDTIESIMDDAIYLAQRFVSASDNAQIGR